MLCQRLVLTPCLCSVINKDFDKSVRIGFLTSHLIDPITPNTLDYLVCYLGHRSTNQINNKYRLLHNFKYESAENCVTKNV